jgi:hypothetical protein
MKIPLLLCLAAVYTGTIFYTMAAYYHIKLGSKWNFTTALMLAVPFVFVEYIFALHANYFLFRDHGFTPSKILIVTICFNFINIWLFNYYVLKVQNSDMIREMCALALIAAALFITKVV